MKGNSKTIGLKPCELFQRVTIDVGIVTVVVLYYYKLSRIITQLLKIYKIRNLLKLIRVFIA